MLGIAYTHTHVDYYIEREYSIDIDGRSFEIGILFIFSCWLHACKEEVKMILEIK